MNVLTSAGVGGPSALFSDADFEALLRNPKSELSKTIAKAPSPSDNKGYVYAIMSPAMPGAIKIGFSADPSTRIDGEHRICYKSVERLMEPVSMVYEKLAERAVKKILQTFGHELTDVVCGGYHKCKHKEWFKPREGADFGEWMATVRNAIEWVSRTACTGGSEKR